VKRTLLAALYAAVVFAVPVGVFASVTPGARVHAAKTVTPPPQDAGFAASVWQNALRATDFVDFTTYAPARLGTTALLLYDDKNLYVGFICDQAGVPLTATQNVNDVGYGLDDEVTIAIDTSGNNSRTYAFTATPLGVRYEYSSESARYEPPWSTVAKTAAHGYRVMMTIPLADMRVASGKTQSWRINFTRRVAATGDLLTWAYDAASNAYCGNNNQGATIYCDATRWPILDDVRLLGVAKAPPPYADVYALDSAGSDRKVFETTPVNFTTQTARFVGLDATVPFTRTLAFVGALGPDFSNVETDQTTIAPQEFTRHYQEYRPFYAEGASFISALPGIGLTGPPNTMFYSPALGILDDGFKVEGTAGNNSIGVLDAKGNGYNDQAFGYGLQNPDGSLGIFAQGVAAHHPGIRDDTLGVGGFYQNLRSGFQPLVTYEQETGSLVSDPRYARSFYAGEITSHGRFRTGGFYEDIGPEFAPADGYTSINDVRGPSLFTFYNGVGTDRGLIKSYSFGVAADRLIDRSGAAHEADVFSFNSLTLKNLLSFQLGSNASELRTYGQAFPQYTRTNYVAFNQRNIGIGYRDGTPSPADFNYSFGPFAAACSNVPNQPLPCESAVNNFSAAYTQQLDLSATRTLHGGYSVTVEYGGTLEHAFAGSSDSQWLRRLTLTRALGSEGQFALSLREISGTGGFASPGQDLALSYHQRFHNQNQLYVEYGSPASYTTLQRFIIKYVYHLGAGGAGT